MATKRIKPPAEPITEPAAPTPLGATRPGYLSTGSTMLNLALTNDPFNGYMCGKYYYFVGDTDSGKTFFTMAKLAEASINSAFDEHRLIRDDTEDGMLMDTDRLFGERVADRVESPSRDGDRPVNSKTIEQFYYHLDDVIAAGKPFIYDLDSHDGLTSESSDKKFADHKRAFRKRESKLRRGRDGGDDAGGDDDKKVAGSFGDGKAKKNSENIRRCVSQLSATGSILTIISQTRDNITGYGPTKTRSGGRALPFYATAQIWTSIKKRIKRNFRDIDRDIGSLIEIEIKRNRITGERAVVYVYIFPSTGIDDIGSCVDYLVKENYWKKTDQTIDAAGLGIVGTREKIIRLIEKRNLETRMRVLCGKCWNDVKAACAVQRKNRYTTPAAMVEP